MKSMAGTVAKIIAPIAGRRGLGEAQLILQWQSVVGAGLARDTLPVKLSFPGAERLDGTLHIRAANGVATELQHLSPQVIERINGFFGYRAVARLAIRQGPLPREPDTDRPKTRRVLTGAEERELAGRLAGIKDEAMRDALEAYGRALLGSTDAVPSSAEGLDVNPNIL